VGGGERETVEGLGSVGRLVRLGQSKAENIKSKAERPTPKGFRQVAHPLSRQTPTLV
jgi:hypothetical protein